MRFLYLEADGNGETLLEGDTRLQKVKARCLLEVPTSMSVADRFLP